MAKKHYKVLSPVSHGEADDAGKVTLKAKRYEPGETIALDEEHAAPLLEAKAIEPAEKSDKAAK